MGDEEFAYRTDRPVEELRKELEDLAAGWTLAEGTEFEAVDANGVPCEWITATCKAQSAITDACYFHVHGGGYYRGSSRVAAPVCSHIAGLAGMKCLSVNYRTAPEHKWPIGVDDTYTAYSWLISHDGGNVDPSKVICGGDSAGGGLILALLLKLRDTDPSKLPAGAVPLSPWTDLTQSSETFITNADSGVSNCDKDYLDHWSKEYLGDADPHHPYASPMFGELHGLPPMLIQVGGGETMLDDAGLFALKAARARCQVALEVYDMQGHVFQNEVGENPVAQEAVRRIVDFARVEIERPGTVPSMAPRL